MLNMCDPAGAVRLFELAACGQRLRAVEHADVVQAEKAAAGTGSPSAAVLAVDPPGEVQRTACRTWS